MKPTPDAAGKTTVLIAEDSPTQAVQLSFILEEHGYRTLVAADGHRALAMSAEERPDLIVSDIIMPGMDGFELCRRIRESDDSRGIPVILLTSLSNPEDVLEGLACGADNFITKPYDEEHLIRQVGQVLDEQPLRSDDGTPVEVEVMFGGKRRAITAERQRMLSLLLSTYEAAVMKNTELIRTQEELTSLNDRLEELVAARTADLNAEVAVRRQAEERVAHLNRVLLAVRNVNQLIVHESDRERLIRKACDLLTGSRGYQNAWLVLRRNDGPPEAWAWSGQGGSSASFARNLSRNTLPPCREAAMAAPGGMAVLDPAGLCASCPFRADCVGDQRIAAVLRHAGGDYGLLGVSLPGHIRIDRDEMSLLEELTGDIAFALHGIGIGAAHKRTERNLKLSEEHWRSTFDVMTDVVTVISEDHEILQINRAGCEVLGLPREEILGQKCYRLMHGRDEPVPECPCLAAVRDGEFRQNVMTENDRHFELNAWPYLDPDGRVVGFTHTIRDVTGSVTAAEEKASLQEQLHQSQKMEAVGTLAGGVAHDFNNLLTIIQGNTDLMMMDMEEDAPLYADMKQIQDAALRAAALTRQLLLFSRKQTMHFTALDFNRSAENLLKMMKRLIGEDIEVALDLEDGIPPVNADPGGIDQTIMNLAVNARDAMPDGGRLFIRTQRIERDPSSRPHEHAARAGTFVCLSITDTGTGMDEETASHVFDPFFTTKEQGKGTGLGLSVVYGIIKQHDGWIDVFSEPGHGTTFRIYFPAITEDGPGRGRTDRTAASAPAKGMRILLVEDEEGVRRITRTILASSGHTIWEADSARSAAEVFERESGAFDLVISDVVLTDASGVSLAEELQRKQDGLKILLTSGYTDMRTRLSDIRAKGHPFIQKPFDRKSLLEKIAETLDA